METPLSTARIQREAGGGKEGAVDGDGSERETTKNIATMRRKHKNETPNKEKGTGSQLRPAVRLNAVKRQKKAMSFYQKKTGEKTIGNQNKVQGKETTINGVMKISTKKHKKKPYQTRAWPTSVPGPRSAAKLQPESGPQS